MKRAPELRDLSDHHHRGLVQARRLRRAATGDEANPPEKIAEAFLEFWQEGTTAHFREEEEVLLPVLARYREDILDREPVVEMLLQHARIRGLVMGLSDEVKGGSVRPETLRSIGELLEAPHPVRGAGGVPDDRGGPPGGGAKGGGRRAGSKRVLGARRAVGAGEGIVLRSLARTRRQRGRRL